MNARAQVGDHYQLPPLVQSAAAAQGGLGESLFRRLCEAHPQVRCLLLFNAVDHELPLTAKAELSHTSYAFITKSHP